MSSRVAWRSGVAVMATAFAVGAPAHGASPIQDYVFDVPVNVRDVDPHFVKGTVSCEIRERHERISGIAGSGSAFFTLSRGSYQGRVAVPVTVVRLVPGMTYNCRVDIVMANGHGAIECNPDRKSQPCAAGGWAQIDLEGLVGLVEGEVPLPGGDEPAKTDGETKPTLRKATGQELRKRQ